MKENYLLPETLCVLGCVSPRKKKTWEARIRRGPQERGEGKSQGRGDCRVTALKVVRGRCLPQPEWVSRLLGILSWEDEILRTIHLPKSAEKSFIKKARSLGLNHRETEKKEANGKTYY